MKNKKVGAQSLVFPSKPRVVSSAAISGDVEGRGPIGGYIDIVLKDDTYGTDSWEKAERKMFEEVVKLASSKCGVEPENLDCLLGGDLLNQLISANFAARTLQAPYIGLYGACSTMAESLLIGSVLIDGGYAELAACTASSHFSTAERQYRFPLEFGGQNTPSAQRTVTGAGCAVISSQERGADIQGDSVYSNIYVTGGTIGKVIDMGITDANNMGAAMAPAAASTLQAHLTDYNAVVDDFDMIVTGDLGRLGSELFAELCMENGIDLKNKHLDCGNLIFSEAQKVDCGGSGCGCSAVTLCAYLLERLNAGDFNKMLFMATGALLSPATTMQGDTIPGIAHGIVLERSDEA